ncbi:hypothetical protein [Streptomyces acidiscabies]|uniref:hypothetical protein n=1 Tax=Streptomyces acidiscabies TaxID=42234 RepID=UPI0038F768EA
MTSAVKDANARGELGAALGDVRAVLGELGVSPEDLTTETYTAAVAASRGRPPDAVDAGSEKLTRRPGA